MCGLTTSPFSRMLLSPSWISFPPALRRGASGDYSLLVGQAMRAFASRSYVWLRCQTRTKLRPVHFECHCGLRSYEVLKRFLPFSLAATSQKVTQVALSAQLRTKIGGVLTQKIPKNPSRYIKIGKLGLGFFWDFLGFFGFFKFPNWDWVFLGFFGIGIFWVFLGFFGIFWDFLGFLNFQIGIGFFWDWVFLGFFGIFWDFLGFLNFQIGIGFFWDWDFLGFLGFLGFSLYFLNL